MKLKRLFSLLTALALLLGLLPGTMLAARAAGRTLAGSGMPSDPYLIASYDDLKTFAAIVNNESSDYFLKSDAWGVLTADIDASSSAQAGDWTPIGKSSSIAFAGRFDGKNHVINGLTCNAPGTDRIGLFGVVAGGGLVSNLSLTGGSLTGGSMVGGVVGENYGTVENCRNTGSVTGYKEAAAHYDYAVGGVVGYNFGSIVNCCNTGSVSGYCKVGVIAGLTNGTLTCCCNAGTVAGNSRAAGVAGQLDGGTVTNAYTDSAKTGNATIGFDNTHGEGLTNVAALPTESMTGPNALTNMTGFSESVWRTTDSYPELKPYFGATEQSPYLIASYDDLKTFASVVNGTSTVYAQKNKTPGAC